MMTRLENSPSPYHHDTDQPFPEYSEQTAPRLIRVHDLRHDPTPEGATRFVRTKVHEVERPGGSTGFQVVNEMADGVSLLPIDVVNGHGYAIMLDQLRYPHVRPEDRGRMTLEAAARAGRIGRWSREIVSGGVEEGESHTQAAIREAAEEVGLVGLREDQIEPIYPELWSSVSVNHQPFDLRVARIEDGQWRPELAFPDVEEGSVRIGAYRLDTAVPEMIDNGTIWEMSAVTAIGGLWRLPEYRQYM